MTTTTMATPDEAEVIALADYITERVHALGRQVDGGDVSDDERQKVAAELTGIAANVRRYLTVRSPDQETAENLRRVADKLMGAAAEITGSPAH
jgi:hypothetical protein